VKNLKNTLADHIYYLKIVLYDKVDNPESIFKELLEFFLESYKNIVDFHADLGFEIAQKIKRQSDKKNFFDPIKIVRQKLSDEQGDRYFSKIEWDYNRFIENSKRIFNPLLENVKTIPL